MTMRKVVGWADDAGFDFPGIAAPAMHCHPGTFPSQRTELHIAGIPGRDVERHTAAAKALAA